MASAAVRWMRHSIERFFDEAIPDDGYESDAFGTSG
jgi:hypothetical protein